MGPEHRTIDIGPEHRTIAMGTEHSPRKWARSSACHRLAHTTRHRPCHGASALPRVTSRCHRSSWHSCLLLLLLGIFLVCPASTDSQAVPRSLQSGDPCSPVGSAWFKDPPGAVAPGAVKACLDSVGLDLESDRLTLDTVAKTMAAFYVFQHAAKYTPCVYSEYDIMAALRALNASAAAKFKTSRELHEAVYSTVAALNDQNTVYSSQCFLSAYHELPLPLVSVVESGQQVIRVAPFSMVGDLNVVQTALTAPAPLQFDLRPYSGARVISIDGVPAKDALLALASTPGIAGRFRDQGTRYNSLFARLAFRSRFTPLEESPFNALLGGLEVNTSALQPFPGLFARRLIPPGRDSVTVLLRRRGASAQEAVEVPWLSFQGRTSTFFSSSDYVGFNCDSSFSTARGLRELHETAAAVVETARVQTLGAKTAHAKTAGAEASVARTSWAGTSHPGRLSPLREPASGVGGAHRGLRGSLGLSTESTGGPDLEGKGQPGSHVGSDVISWLRGRELTTRRRFGPRALTLGLNPGLPEARLLTKSSDYIKAFVLRGLATAVVTIPDFPFTFDNYERAELDPSSVQFVEHLARAFRAMPSSVQRVILDLRGTLGSARGDARPAWAALLALMGSERVSRRKWTAPVQLLSSAFVRAMVNESAGPYSSALFTNLAQQPFTPATRSSFFYPQRRQSWGGYSPLGKYSSFVKADLGSTVFNANAPGLIGSRSLLLLTDGTCAHACSLFAETLKRSFSVPVAVVGGPLGSDTPVSISNGCSAAVAKSAQDDLIAALPASLSSDASAPQPFVRGADLRLTLGAARIPEEAFVPCDFPCVGADFQLNYTLDSVTNPARLWQAAEKLF